MLYQNSLQMTRATRGASANRNGPSAFCLAHDELYTRVDVYYLSLRSYQRKPLHTTAASQNGIAHRARRAARTSRRGSTPHALRHSGANYFAARAAHFKHVRYRKSTAASAGSARAEHLSLNREIR